MMAETANQSLADPGLTTLVTLLRFNGIGTDPGQIRHRFGSSPIGIPEMLRVAKELGLKARARRSEWSRLPNTPLPAIAALKDGSFLFLGKVGDDKALVQSPSSPRPALMTRAEFEAVWDGRLVLMTRRANLLDLSRRFDVTWFLGAIHKYRRMLGEVLFASFFLQLFALVSPLFFQVVIDKVLVHRSMSTLDVLIIGLVAIGVFETILGILRTYLFAHTTNRIDVELGARLFRHLVALPIAYFQARRVGDSVARVRELENIRNFLTSSALTLVIDLLFTFVFLAVMFFYSPFLTWIVIGAFPFYIAISAGATPLFRRRLDEKFQRGAENQAFLVESVTGVETLKAMAVEPQMQRRWEEQLAGYVAASFRVISLGNTASQAVPARQQAGDRRNALFRSEAGDRGRSHSRRACRLQHAGLPRELPGAAASSGLARLSPGSPLSRAARRHSQHRGGADLQSGARCIAGNSWRHRFRARHLPLSHRRSGGAA
jgi:ATP-binding cassette, subfamily B, bacterial HlyB/CyaB